MKRVFLLIGFFGLFQMVLSQEEPKVGVVLSGGGAKGLAHIGALKVIEEAGVKVDYIGGTSMGAIVGALYASGYSATELDSIFRVTDFTELIQDDVPRGAKTFYEKDDSERYALSLPFDKFKVSFPQGISGGQRIYNELVQLLYHVKDVRDFGQLPIPFICIATNIETGEEVLLDSGFLPEAITASGTFPSLFEPSEIDGKVLIDGGVVNNYPIDEVRAMGADIIIGVDVQHGLVERESLSSATGILLQINNYRTVKDMVEKRKQTDVYIKPEIDDFSVIDFDYSGEIMDSGEVGANTKYDELVQVAQKQSGRTGKEHKVSISDSLTINRLMVKGDSRYSRGYIKGKLRIELGTKISFEKLEQGINNLAATGNFKALRYELASNGLGTDLILKLQDEPTKMFIKMGAHYDDLYKSAALINLTRKGLLFQDDVASFDFILGDHIRYNLEYYIDKGAYWSFGINSTFTDFDEEIDYGLISSNFDVVDDPNIGEILLDVTDLTNQIYLQTVLREEFAFSIGAEHKLLRYSTRTLTDAGQNAESSFEPTAGDRTFFEDSSYFSTFGKLTLDTYDDKYFPTEGLYFDGDFHFYLFSSDFNDNFREFSIAKARMGTAFGLFGDLSLNIETEGGFKLGTSAVSSFDFVLGGFGNDLINNFTPFIGYDFLSLPGNSFVKAYMRLDYEIAPKNHFLFTANVANVDDDLFRTGEWFTEPNFSGFGIGYGLESFLGPVQIYYSWSPQIDDGNFFFSIGYWF
ncbi:patatin-like phospholipase family protein [Allomuricauda sp. SCSIO 65647]|uniref:patatin-like phospholipase family protein n=1 Tax=Allomuricauda sp. SCSIO 65647 TaxID=2908843 RepID=UPI001F394C2A|nr:patatin-like phospholipase family protein [Muricauda sp. SCSIO 65647]UJH66072.1 patatin-like phospholipase family protein [Muricauda sp. SCSIO 65647]